MKWKVVGQVAYHWDNRPTKGSKFMKPGQVFEAEEKEMPLDLLRICIPLDGNLVEIPVVKPPVVIPVVGLYYKKMRKDEKYNIYDSNNKRVNEKLLTEAEADEILKNLNR